MSPPEPATKQNNNADQNPKSILLTDRHHHHHHHHNRHAATVIDNKTVDHNNLHVTFAKTGTNNKQSNVSSATSMNPSVDPSSKVAASSDPGNANKSSAAPSSASNLKVVSKGSNELGQATGKTDSKGKGESISGSYITRKSELEKTLKQNPRSAKAFADWLSSNSKKAENKRAPGVSTSLTSSKRSVETIDSAGKDSTASADAAKPTTASKSSRKRMRKLAKASSRSVGGTPKKVKSKKLKKSKKGKDGTEGGENKDKAMEVFKPAPLDAEYASELNKINQILKAVSVTDHDAAAAKTEANSKVDARGVRRPLSGDELKQLLSSITRVVSLHELDKMSPPTTSTISGVPKPDEDPSKVEANDKTPEPEKEKPKKHKKKKSHKQHKEPPNYVKDTLSKSRSRIAIEKLQAVEKQKKLSSTKKPRPKVKSERSSSHRRSYSEGGSSVSSLEKQANPVQNAAFLRKYFEESTRLANKKSSEEIVNSENPEDENSSQKKKKKKGKKGSKDLSFKTSQPYLPPNVLKRLSQHQGASQQPPREKVVDKSGLSVVGRSVTRQNIKVSSNRSNPLPPRTISRSSSKKKSDGKVRDNISTTAVKGSPRRPLSPVPGGDAESVVHHPNTEVSKNESTTESETLKAIAQSIPDKPVKTPPSIISSGNPSSSVPTKTQEQFQNVEEIINNSKLTTDMAKTKTLWEKTPYQPMTHARFKDMVSRYADAEAVIGMAKSEDPKAVPMQANKKMENVIPASYTTGPGNLLTLPKTWEIKEKLARQPVDDKSVRELQRPPSYWPASEATSTFNRINYDYKYNMRREARQIRRRLREETNNKPPPQAPPNVMGSTRADPTEVQDALKFYRDSIRRNAKTF